MFFLEFGGHAWAAVDLEVAVFMDLFDLGNDRLRSPLLVLEGGRFLAA